MAFLVSTRHTTDFLYGEANCSLRERRDMITAVLLAAIYALPHAVYYKLLLNAAEYAIQLTVECMHLLPGRHCLVAANKQPLSDGQQIA